MAHTKQIKHALDERDGEMRAYIDHALMEDGQFTADQLLRVIGVLIELCDEFDVTLQAAINKGELIFDTKSSETDDDSGEHDDKELKDEAWSL